ncbi:MAG: SH3 domain-containing protein [Oscillospiraceae bacterium]|nr:SH3 domain-containing protein [Oscillospiraceae bacterium]
MTETFLEVMIIRKFKTLFICSFIVLIMLMLPNTASAAGNAAAGVVNVSSGRLNVRSEASSTSSIKTKLYNGSFVTIHSQSGNWYYLEYGKNQFGYCHSSYISNLGGSYRKINTSSGRLNVRAGGGYEYAVIDSLYSGEKVVVLSSSAYWSKILYHGNKTGFVYNIYLGPISSSQTDTKSISLNVPSYKQYDSRWSGIKIGSGGGTIGTIGCATTAIAMMESYRTGTAITPASMRYKLSYTASGSVYWPSNYSVNTQSSNYLTNIYNILKSGKPVLLGMKNTYGGQHWVIIKGFKGGSIATENFTINDPGSSTRISLSEFISAYPIFYKYFTY